MSAASENIIFCFLLCSLKRTPKQRSDDKELIDQCVDFDPSDCDDFNNNDDETIAAIEDPPNAKRIKYEDNDDDGTIEDGKDETCDKNAPIKDEFTVFGNFVAYEMRQLKTEQYRRKLQLILQKALLQIAEEEEAMLNGK